MIVLYILLALIGLEILYILFLFLLSFSIPKKEYDKDSPFFRFLLNLSTRRILGFLRIHATVNGFDKVPKETKCLFVSNHRSNYDPIITWMVFKDWKLAYISKKENFSIPIFGRYIRKCCFMAIDRKDIRKAVPTLRKAGELLKAGEVSIGVYPEGKRSKDCVLLPFHDCVFKIAQMGSSPIVVLSVEGTENIFKNIKHLRRSDVVIDVLEVISKERTEEMRTCEISEEIRGLMEKDLKEDDKNE